MILPPPRSRVSGRSTKGPGICRFASFREDENPSEPNGCSRAADSSVRNHRGAGELGRLDFRGVRHPQRRLTDRDHVGLERRADQSGSLGHKHPGDHAKE